MKAGKKTHQRAAGLLVEECMYASAKVIASCHGHMTFNVMHVTRNTSSVWPRRR